VRRLLENGFDANVMDADCRVGNALAAAARVNVQKIFDILVDAGASVNEFRETVEDHLSAAWITKNEKLVHKIIDMGFDLNRTLHFVHCNDSTELTGAHWSILELLLKAGMRGNSETPLWPRNGEEARSPGWRRLRRFPPLVWKYMRRADWNLLSRNAVIWRMASFQEFVGKIQPLKHICRIAIRESLMLSGRCPSMYKADLSRLGLPKALQDYLIYS